MGGTGETTLYATVACCTCVAGLTRVLAAVRSFLGAAHPFTATTQDAVAVQLHSISDMRRPQNWLILCPLLYLISWVLAAPTEDSMSTQSEKNFL